MPCCAEHFPFLPIASEYDHLGSVLLHLLDTEGEAISVRVPYHSHRLVRVNGIDDAPKCLSWKGSGKRGFWTITRSPILNLFFGVSILVPFIGDVASHAPVDGSPGCR